MSENLTEHLWRDTPGGAGGTKVDLHVDRERRKSEASLKERRRIEEKREQERQQELARREAEATAARKRYESEEHERGLAQLEVDKEKQRRGWIASGGTAQEFDRAWPQTKQMLLTERAQNAEAERRAKAVSVRDYW